MIAECAQDLLNRLEAIPALATKVGFALAGSLPDPGAVQVTPPAAWLLFAGFQNTRDPAAREYLPAPQLMATLHFVAVLYVPVAAQIGTQLPLLQTVLKAVQGQTSPTGQRWYADSGKLLSFNADRITYELNFAVNASI